MPEVATSRQEIPVFFSAGKETLFGVVTEPVGEPRGIGVILLYGGGYTMSSYYNQYWTRMARRVSALGFHALRFDHHGNGDSTGRVDAFDHRAPFADDVVSAMSFMETQGVSRFLLVGDCLGGRGTLVAASRVEAADGVFMISAMVRDGRMEKAEDWAQKYGIGHYVRRALRWKTIRKLASRDLRRAYLKVGSTKLKQVAAKPARALGRRQPTEVTQDNGGASNRFLEPLEGILKRGAHVHFVYGDEDEERTGEFETARGARLGQILKDAGSLVEITTVAGTIADIQDPPAQDAIIDEVADWVSRVAAAG
jgi:pimeloyl-ACP methyl ester carboxylesterase